MIILKLILLKKLSKNCILGSSLLEGHIFSHYLENVAVQKYPKRSNKGAKRLSSRGIFS